MPERDQASARHEATPRQLERARREGQVAIGRDLVLWAGLAAGFGVVALGGGAFLRQAVEVMRRALLGLPEAPFADLLAPLFGLVAFVVLAGGVVATASAAVTLLQTRGGLWLERVAPDPSRLFEPGRLTRMWNGEALLDLGLSVLKVAAVGAVTWVAMRDGFVTLPGRLLLDPSAQWQRAFGLLGPLAVRVVGILAPIAGIDLAIAHLRHRRKLRMTDEEIKRETKDEEGDGLIRSRRKDRHRDLMRGRLTTEVPRADVVVVNPTHIAVALRYEPGRDAAPRVVAKGSGARAETIRRLAREHQVPIYRDVLLARLLFRRVRVGRCVPAETFEAVAAILAWVWRLPGRRPHAHERGLSA